MRRLAAACARGERGVVLVLTLVVLTLLVTVTGSKVLESSLASAAAVRRSERIQIYLALRDGVGIARRLAQQDGAATVAQIDDMANDGAVTVAVAPLWQFLDPEKASSLNDALQEDAIPPSVRQYLGAMGRLNVNRASDDVLRERLDYLPGDVIAALLQRRAETPFEHTEELREIPGLTGELYVRLVRDVSVFETDFAAVIRYSSPRTSGTLLVALAVAEGRATVAGGLFLP